MPDLYFMQLLGADIVKLSNQNMTMPPTNLRMLNLLCWERLMHLRILPQMDLIYRAFPLCSLFLAINLLLFLTKELAKRNLLSNSFKNMPPPNLLFKLDVVLQHERNGADYK